MWEYTKAFMYIDDPSYGGAYFHESSHMEIVQNWSNLHDLDFDKAYQMLTTLPVTFGHVGKWYNANIIINNAQYEADRFNVKPIWEQDKNPKNYKQRESIAVFFSHGMLGGYSKETVKDLKPKTLAELGKSYPGIREATPDELYKNIDEDRKPYLMTTYWFTGMNDASDHLASFDRAKRYFDTLYPNEVHNVGGDCLNPKCDYVLTSQDKDEVDQDGGWFTCPKCGSTYNYYDISYNGPGGTTRAGLTPREMGLIGEDLVESLSEIPGVGKILERHPTTDWPIDFTIGNYAVEVKTNHSESQPRFKMGDSYERSKKIEYAQAHNLLPATLGVRLNFYTDKADLFFRPAYSDTWIGAPTLTHIGTYDFTEFNPFKHPEDVPSEMPDSDDEFGGTFGTVAS